MSHEFLVIDSIVETVPIGWERPKTSARSLPCEGERLERGVEASLRARIRLSFIS